VHGAERALLRCLVVHVTPSVLGVWRLAAAVDRPHHRRRLALAVVQLIRVAELRAHVSLTKRALNAALVHKRCQRDAVEAEALRLHCVEDTTDAHRRLVERLGLEEWPRALWALGTAAASERLIARPRSCLKQLTAHSKVTHRLAHRAASERLIARPRSCLKQLTAHSKVTHRLAHRWVAVRPLLRRRTRRHVTDGVVCLGESAERSHRKGRWCDCAHGAVVLAAIAANVQDLVGVHQRKRLVEGGRVDRSTHMPGHAGAKNAGRDNA